MVTVQSVPEQRIVLHHVGWDTYEALMRDHADSSAPHFTYDRGELEIVSPLPIHERYTHFIELFVAAVTDRLGIDETCLASTTFKQEELERGFEPDTCFYVQHESLIRGKDRLDLRVDPPPDVVVEIDITRSSIDKLSIFASFVVPEVWRYDGERLEILVWTGDGYTAHPRSRALPVVFAEALATLLRDSLALSDSAWRRRVRAWAEGLPAGPDVD